MAKEILYTTAIDENGELILVDKAKKGEAYYCPLCKTEFVLHRSGNTGKGSKRPHFEHSHLTTNCTPEGVLHYSFKKLLIGKLEEHLAGKKELEIKWNCSACHQSYTGNLLKDVHSIKEEYNLRVCQPDIALLDANEEVVATIEIVVTHEPEENALQYYKENTIILIQINLSSEEDLNFIENRIANLDSVNYCLNPRCSCYGWYPIERRIKAYPDKCNRCYQPIEKYCIEIESRFSKFYYLDFTENEISIVKLHNANVQMSVNQSTNEEYPTPICLTCKMLTARHRGNRRL